MIYASNTYRELLINWCRHAEKAGVYHYVTVCLDRELYKDMWATDYVVYQPVDLTTPEHHPKAALGKLWQLRADNAAYLADLRLPFIHCDTDSVLLRDPRDLFKIYYNQFDVTFAHGDNFPVITYNKWGFNPSVGFYYSSASEGAARFWSDVAMRTQETLNDQIALCESLVNFQIEWQAAFHKYGNGDGLSVGLLGEYLFQRFEHSYDNPYFVHPAGSRFVDDKIKTLKDLGYWLA